MQDAAKAKAATRVTKRTRVKNEPSVPRHVPAGKPSDAQLDNDSKYTYDTVFFKSIRSANKRGGEFTVHPEWASEVLAPPAVARLTAAERYATYPGRRCRSAPGRHRNPITWEANPYYQCIHPTTLSYQCDGPGNPGEPGKAPQTRGRARDRQDARDKRRTYNFEGTFFGSVGTPRKRDFVINPEWMSEQPVLRRSKSAPPPRSRNPITWQ